MWIFPYPIGLLHKYIPLPGTELYKTSIKYGLKEPKELEGWIYFDFESVLETIEKVRPWLSNDLLNYVDKANNFIEKLNNLYTGNNLDKKKIDLVKNDIKCLLRKWKW